MSEQHIETFKATAIGKDWPTTVSITDTEFTLQLDEPVEEGGTNSGANPMQYFAASLAGCQNEQAQVVAEELAVKLSKINIDLEIDLDLAGFMGTSDHSNNSYKQVRMKTTVLGDLTNDQVQELGKRVDARCPILGLLRTGGCEIISSWNIVQ
jgi:putative redox protein